MKPDHLQAEPSDTPEAEGINLLSVYRLMLRIVAQLDNNEYTEDMLRQTTEVVLDDLANPASDPNTSQG